MLRLEVVWIVLYCRTVAAELLGEMCSGSGSVNRVDVSSCRGRDMVESGGRAYIGSEVPKNGGSTQERIAPSWKPVVSSVRISQVPSGGQVTRSGCGEDVILRTDEFNELLAVDGFHYPISLRDKAACRNCRLQRGAERLCRGTAAPAMGSGRCFKPGQVI